MSLTSLLGVITFLCLTTTVSQAAVSLSKPFCPETCGDITIPYPFGIGPNCSANSSFAVICQNSTSPFLTSFDLEILNISIRSNTVRVLQPVSPLNCSDGRNTRSLGTSLLGSIFSISNQNSLALLGCDNSIWLRSNGTMIERGCAAICGANYNDTSCNGVNCCQTTIPRGLQEIQFTVNRTTSANASSCGYAFIADRTWFQKDYTIYAGFRNDLRNPFDERFRNTSMVLEWGFDLERANYSICQFRNSSFGNGSSSGECFCQLGFEGNPYLTGGCHDINECIDPRFRCPKGTTCVNQFGYYDCKKSGAKIAAIAIGSGLGTLFLLIGVLVSYRVIRKRIKANRRQKFFKKNGGLLLEQQLSSTDNGVQKTKLFTSKQLAQATDHYNENRILGCGGQGTVYKGMLADGRIVAVKKSKKVEEYDLDFFINEVVILSQINHRNIVKVLGCCLETEVPLLVYEFIPNGTLYELIHEPNDDEFPLSWDTRVRIATEVARAISYLHSSASVPIYHCDIKSSNILLDEKYRAKVADFGTSRSIAIDQTHVTTRVLGTFGYLDPEYFQSSQFTDKSDVYSFGVVMVELLTGEKAITAVREEGGRSLATHFLNSMEENKLFDILDPRVLREGRKEEILAIANLSRRCLNLNGKRRPTMMEAAVELEGVQMSKQEPEFQDSYDDKEYHSANLYDGYDFSSTSGSMRMDTTSTSSSDVHPLLSSK